MPSPELIHQNISRGRLTENSSGGQSSMPKKVDGRYGKWLFITDKAIIHLSLLSGISVKSQICGCSKPYIKSVSFAHTFTYPLVYTVFLGNHDTHYIVSAL